MATQPTTKAADQFKSQAKQIREMVTPTFKAALTETISSDLAADQKVSECNRIIDELVSFLDYSEKLANTVKP